MQDRVFNTTDILVDRQPVIGPLIQHGCVIIRTAKPGKIPGRFKKRIEGVGFATRRPAGFRVARVQKFIHVVQRRTHTGEVCMFRQHHRQFRFRNGG